MIIIRIPLFLLLTSLLLTVTDVSAAAEQPELSQDIQRLITTSDLHIDGVDILTRGTLLDAYQDNGFKPFWTSPEKVRELLELIKDATNHGLSPADYNIEQLSQILHQRESSASAEISAEADILLSESLLRYGYHRRMGKVEAAKLDSNINYKRETFHHQSVELTFEQAINSSSLPDFIEKVAPRGPVYRNLQTKLVNYREIAANGGWSPVSDGPTLRVGDEDSRVVEIRKFLVIVGDLPGNADTSSQIYDKEVKSAVESFQERHALQNDGIVGSQTIATMNIPVETRLDQLRISLERLRWVNQEAHDTLVAVNIAGFRAFFVRDGSIEWYTRVMVGKTYRKTPIFTGEIAYLEFNPTWTIPPGIIRNDTLPAIKKDPNYLASHNIKVYDKNGKHIDESTIDWTQYRKGVPYTLRQDPGPHNSLGMVKFIFPNEHFVFLHDTPHRELFVQPERSFSSGCVRVQNPFELAELILNDPEKYNQSALQAIVDSRKTQRINIRPKMPVVILYLTASIDPGGKVRFFRDIYNRDQKVLDALNGPVVITMPETG